MEENQIKQKFPVGMIIILVIIGYGAVAYLLGAFMVPMLQLGPVLFTGTVATLADLLIACVLVIIFYGIVKKFKWARKLSIGCYILSMVLPIINIISFYANKTIFDNYYRKNLSPSLYAGMDTDAKLGGLIIALVLAWIFGLIIIKYLSKKKDFFVN